MILVVMWGCGVDLVIDVVGIDVLMSDVFNVVCFGGIVLVVGVYDFQLFFLFVLMCLL